MPRLLVTVVRHGESTDNLSPIWAGWKDAPLSNHGMNQAKLVGRNFRDVPKDAIYCSDLLRAHWTAINIYNHHANHIDESLSDVDGNAPSPPPHIRTNELKKPTTSKLMREQYFGDAEGASWLEGPYANPSWDKDRQYKFPNAESLADVHARANQVVDRVVRPWTVLATERDCQIFLVAHGIANAEMVQAICLLDPNHPNDYLGSMANTSYHTLELTVPDSALPVVPALVKAAREAVDTDSFPEVHQSIIDAQIPVQVKVAVRNSSEHTKALKRRKAEAPVAPAETKDDPRSG